MLPEPADVPRADEQCTVRTIPAPPTPSEQREFVSPVRVAAGLAAPLPLFVVLNLWLGFLLFFGADDEVGLAAVLRFFDLNGERTVPAWYSTVLLFLSAIISWIIARYHQLSGARFTLHWYLLAAIFVYLSMDENLSIHEKTIKPIRNFLGVSGFLYWAWVIPGWVFVLTVGSFYWKFVWSLPETIRRHVIGAAIVYVPGALDLGLRGGVLQERYGAGVAGEMSTMTEELLEFTGLIWFIYAQLRYLNLVGGSADTAQIEPV